MSNVRPLATGQQIVTVGDSSSAVVNRFEQVAAIAKPTLDAIVKLRDARMWLADRQRFPRVMINLDQVDEQAEDEARARLDLIPEAGALQKAAQLFDDAARKSAPEAWFHLALGAMLASMPNARNVTPDYQFGVVDTTLRDEESWERDCEPGFSAPIFISAIRKVRREEEFVPSAAKILKACQEYRKRFKQLRAEVAVLIAARENAEETLKDWDLAVE
jgi:hypothetical protein